MAISIAYIHCYILTDGLILVHIIAIQIWYDESSLIWKKALYGTVSLPGVEVASMFHWVLNWISDNMKRFGN